MILVVNIQENKLLLYILQETQWIVCILHHIRLHAMISNYNDTEQEPRLTLVVTQYG